MKKQKRVGLLNKKISNRLSYTIIAFVSLMLVGIFVFAAAPNPGHDYNDLDLGPVSIYGNEEAGSLEVTAGPVRAAAFCLVDDTCITTWPTGGSSFWSVGGYGGIYYNDRVGIAGNTGPNGLELDVNGQIGADSYCDSQGYSCKTITELSSGGGSTPTLAQVLAQGYDAEGRNIYNVGTLSIKDGGSINTYYGQIEIKDKNINMKSGGNILNAGTITANTVQANTLEDPEDDKVTVNDNLIVNGYIGGPKIGVVTTLGTSTCSSDWRNLVDLTYYTVDPAYCVAVLQECQTHADSEPEDCACRISGNYLQVLNNEDGCDDYVYTKCAAICGII